MSEFIQIGAAFIPILGVVDTDDGNKIKFFGRCCRCGATEKEFADGDRTICVECSRKENR